jgi:hypothetical protein
MDFIDLHRWFAPVRKDQELNPDVGQSWGARLYGWLDWPALRAQRRVVLLAEAGSGKSEEFRNQARMLAAEGKPAFFLRIEELADQGFEAALGPAEATAFETWKTGTAEGFFFLDSIDEARLNRKSFESALKRFARESGPALERASVYVSCRVYDWNDREDRRAIMEWLPAHRQAAGEAAADEHAGLLAPIFEERATARRPARMEETQRHELLAVQLVPLDAGQSTTLAKAAGVANPEAFAAAIASAGLEAFRQRPGDVLDLATYWTERGAFDSFAAMVDHGIERKLAERDAYRADNQTLPADKARYGAERLAAALTLGKSFTLRAPGAEHDPSMTAGAINPQQVLNEWSDAERNALLRRGVFAPATFGRIRFHHRATQEYLTAQWLHRMLLAGCPKAEVWSLVFAERYGIPTLVPSMRPAAAWLALQHPDMRDEIIAREPMVLLQHGDPRSVDIDARRRLLAALAERHAEGEVSDTSLDSRNFAMFADARLAPDIRAAWAANSRAEFRFMLLCLIRDGAIPGCEAILRDVAKEPGERNYARLVALGAMAACGDRIGLEAAAREAMADPANLSAYMAAGIAGVLYPHYLTTADVLTLIAESASPGTHATGGFAYEIAELYRKVPSVRDRTELIDGLGDLCLAPPFVESYHRISTRYGYLADHLRPIAAAEIEALDGRLPSTGLVRLLMAIERSDRHAPLDKDEPPLHARVHANPHVNRALVWADAAETRANAEAWEKSVTRHWQIYFGTNDQLWGAGEADLEWLFDDAANRPEADDRRIAFSLIVAVLRGAGRIDTDRPRLESAVAMHPDLAVDLAAYLTPPVEGEKEREYRLKREARKLQSDKKDADAKASWIDYSAALRAEPGQLCAAANLVSWQAGVSRLKHLTYWLQRKTGLGDDRAAREWRLLEEGFGRAVAEAYRDGMRALWRHIVPARPQRGPGGQVNHKWTHILAFAGIGVDAAETRDWPEHLSAEDAALIARHACLSEQGCPDWIDRLIQVHPQAVLPVIGRELAREWATDQQFRWDYLSRFGSKDIMLSQPLQDRLLKIMLHREAGRPDTLERAIAIVQKLELDDNRRLELWTAVNGRYAEHVASGNEEFAVPNLAILLLLRPDEAFAIAGRWIGADAPEPGATRAARIIATLFDGHHRALALPALSRASVGALEHLLRLAYRHIRPQDDVHHVGTYSPDVRDHAESARNTILSALLDRPGPDAYWTIRHLADDADFAVRLHRFRELAHGKAEKDCEPPAWLATEVREFELSYTAPVKTGSDLLRVTLAVLAEINFQLAKGDVTSRPLLERAQDEDEVQSWLAEQMMLRAKGRFHVYREAEVALGDMPDIVAASTAAPCEVAIEVKHGGKDWSFRQLDAALRTQLAEDYLKPATRRHGILVITRHSHRRWADPDTGQRLDFPALISMLSASAKGIVHNSSGAIEVACVGIDATDPRACD